MARGKPWAEPKSSEDPTPLRLRRLNTENSQSVQREDCTSVCVCVLVTHGQHQKCFPPPPTAANPRIRSSREICDSSVLPEGRKPLLKKEGWKTSQNLGTKKDGARRELVLAYESGVLRGRQIVPSAQNKTKGGEVDILPTQLHRGAATTCQLC